MKSSLVSATSIAALLALEASPAMAQTFTINGNLNFGNALVNCAAFVGCTPVTANETATNKAASTISVFYSKANKTYITGGNTTVTLAASGTQTQTYTFAPTITGSTTAAAVVQQKAATNATQYTVTMTGTGVAPIETATFGASLSSNFVLVNSTQTANVSVTIKNTGNGNTASNAPTSVSNLNGSVSITGAGYSGASSVSLNDGASTSKTYVFQPTATGASNGVASTAFSNGSANGQNTAQTVNTTYTGTGVAPLEAMTGGSISHVLVGTTKTVSLTVSNNGNGNKSGAGTVSNLLGTIGNASGLFALQSGTSVSLGSGSGIADTSTQTITYVFAPTGIGTASSSVSGSFSNGGTIAGGINTNISHSNTATLSGDGVAPIENVAVTNSTKAGNGSTPGTGQLGYVLVNSAANSAAAVVTVTNTGNGDLAGIDSPSLMTNLHGTQGTPGSSVFTPSGGNPSSTINLQDVNGPGGSTTAAYTYNFVPTQIGSTSDTVTTSFVNGVGAGGQNASGSATTTLSGTGVAPVESSSGSNAGYTLVTATSGVSVTIHNTGNGNLSQAGTISNLNGSLGAASGSFTGSGGSVSLTDTSSTTISYVFAPSARGTASTTVTGNFDNGGGATNASHAASATLTGTGCCPDPVRGGQQCRLHPGGQLQHHRRDGGKYRRRQQGGRQLAQPADQSARLAQRADPGRTGVQRAQRQFLGQSDRHEFGGLYLCVRADHRGRRLGLGYRQLHQRQCRGDQHQRRSDCVHCRHWRGAGKQRQQRR